MSCSKSSIRAEMQARREAQPPDEIRIRSRAIAERLYALPAFQQAAHVMFYLSLAVEVQTDEMLARALQLQKKVYVPVTDKEARQLWAVELPSLDAGLAAGPFGIREPRTRPAAAAAPRLDLIVAPGVAFDARGGRVGFGAGYYDRFLKTLPSTAWRVGLAFDFQVLATVPQTGGDVRMHQVITESRVISGAWNMESIP